MPLVTRPPLRPPSHDQANRVCSIAGPRVQLRHPGYLDRHNVLFVLLAPDDADGGIHHETARVACALVAGNRWDGYLSASSACDAPPLTVDLDDVLPCGSYYFHVPGARQYAVCPSFREWPFPHNNLPASWQAAAAACFPPPAAGSARAPSALSAALLLRDGSCRISACEEGCQVAHVVPQQETGWFFDNSMADYADPAPRSSAAINDARNACLLRADLHTAFDQSKFVFVPKPTPPDAVCAPFVVHLIDARSTELRRVYHNTPLQAPLGVAVEFLLARFAWSIFRLLEAFLQHQVPRKLLLSSSEEPVVLDPEQCARYTRSGARSRSASPKKRGRPAEPEPEESYEQPGDAAPCKRVKVGRLDMTSPPPSGPTSPLVCTDDHRLDVAKYRAITPPLGVETLRRACLERERERSDPSGSWQAEQDWLEEAMKRPLGQSELRRYWEARGFDLIDEEQD